MLVIEETEQVRNIGAELLSPNKACWQKRFLIIFELNTTKKGVKP